MEAIGLPLLPNFELAEIFNFCWKIFARKSLAALHKGAAGQMTGLEDPPPCLRPTYWFA